MKPILRSEAGDSLLELALAVAIFALSLTMLLGVATHSRQSAVRASYAYKAHLLAKSHIERLKAYSFVQLPDAVEADTAVNEAGEEDAAGDYSRTTEVTTSYAGDPALTQVKVSVTYRIRGQDSAQPMEITEVLYGGA